MGVDTFPSPYGDYKYRLKNHKRLHARYNKAFPSPYGDYKYRQTDIRNRKGNDYEQCFRLLTEIINTDMNELLFTVLVAGLNGFRLLTEIINTDPLAQNPVILPSQATLCVPKANPP